MFRCQKCGRITEAREPQHKLVTKTRIREYDGGKETAEEINICVGCFNRIKEVN